MPQRLPPDEEGERVRQMALTVSHRPYHKGLTPGSGWLFRGLAIGCCLFFGIISCVLDCMIGVGRTSGLGCVSPLMGPFALLFGNFLKCCGVVYWLIALFVVLAPAFTGWLLRRHQLLRELEIMEMSIFEFIILEIIL